MSPLSLRKCGTSLHLSLRLPTGASSGVLGAPYSCPSPAARSRRPSDSPSPRRPDVGSVAASSSASSARLASSSARTASSSSASRPSSRPRPPAPRRDRTGYGPSIPTTRPPTGRPSTARISSPPRTWPNPSRGKEPDLDGRSRTDRHDRTDDGSSRADDRPCPGGVARTCPTGPADGDVRGGSDAASRDGAGLSS